MMGQGRFLGLGVVLLAIPLVADGQARETGFLDRSLVVEAVADALQVQGLAEWMFRQRWPR